MDKTPHFVEDIVDIAVRRGKVNYQVKWLGFPSSQNTWEPFENLNKCENLIRHGVKVAKVKFVESEEMNFISYDEQRENGTLKKNRVNSNRQPFSDRNGVGGCADGCRFCLANAVPGRRTRVAGAEQKDSRGFHEEPRRSRDQTHARGASRKIETTHPESTVSVHGTEAPQPGNMPLIYHNFRVVSSKDVFFESLVSPKLARLGQLQSFLAAWSWSEFCTASFLGELPANDILYFFPQRSCALVR
ncbi:hypothetical protein ACFE04_011148 [Oxalis oulophora]